MRKFILCFLLAIINVFIISNSQAQIRITDFPTYVGDPTGGWVPIVMHGINRKIDARYFVYNKLDSITLVTAVPFDTLYQWSNGTKIRYLLLSSGASSLLGIPVDTTGLANNTFLYYNSGSNSYKFKTLTASIPITSGDIPFGNGSTIISDGKINYNGGQLNLNLVDNYGGLHLIGRNGGESSFSLQPSTVPDGGSGQWILYTNGTNLHNQNDFAFYSSELGRSVFVLSSANGYLGINNNNPRQALDVGGFAIVRNHNNGSSSDSIVVHDATTGEYRLKSPVFSSPSLTVDSLFIAPEISSGMISPPNINMGQSFGSASPGSYYNAKLKLYDGFNFAGDYFGFGVSVNNLEISAGVGSSFTWYVSGVQKAQLSSTGDFIIPGSSTASSFIKSGGIGSQYLMADGTTKTLDTITALTGLTSLYQNSLKLNKTDTSSMLNSYARKNFISGQSPVNYSSSTGVISVDTSSILATQYYVSQHSGSGGLAQIYAKAPLTILGTDTIKADTSTALTGLTTLYQVGLRLLKSDTSSMLNPYLRKSDTTAMILPYARSIAVVKYSDTAAMLSPYLRKIDTTAMLSTYSRSISVVKYADTSTMLSPYARLISVVKYSDTSSMLTPYLHKIDTTAMLSPYSRSISTVKYSDTATMLSPYSRSISVVKYSDTSSMLSVYLRKSDTTAMLSPYARTISVMKYSDTASMLSPYARSIAVVKYTDTASMLSPYLRKIDTASLSSRINALSYTFSTGLTNISGTITDNLATGVSGGQSVIGGTASGNALTLSSTSNATKGLINFGNSFYDEANNYMKLTKSSLGVTLDTLSGLSLVNNAIATSSVQQISPPITFRGSGWKTNTTAGAQNVIVRQYILPASNAIAPTVSLKFDFSTDGGTTYQNLFSVASNSNNSNQFTNVSFQSTGLSMAHPNIPGINLNGGVPIVNTLTTNTNYTITSNALSANQAMLNISPASSTLQTSGTNTGLLLTTSYAPTSGTGLFHSLTIANTINQTGGANGITRGLYVNATLTAAADYRAIETSSGASILNGLLSVNTSTKSTTAGLLIGAGTTTVAPILLTSGSLLTSPIAGSEEFLTDKRYFTITTGTARKEYALWDAAGTSGRVPYETTNGRLIDNSNLTYDGTTLTVPAVSLTTPLAVKYSHTIFTPTTGQTISVINNQYNIVNPAGALVALTINLPSSPSNNDVVYIKFTQTISTVTYANGTVVDGITAPVAGGLVVLTYDSGTTSWY